MHVLNKKIDKKMFYSFVFVLFLQTYFITSLDAHMIDIPELKEVRSNLTAVRLMSSTDVEALNIVNQWKEKKKYFNAEQYRYAQQFPYVLSDRIRVSKSSIIDNL